MLLMESPLLSCRSLSCLVVDTGRQDSVAVRERIRRLVDGCDNNATCSTEQVQQLYCTSRRYLNVRRSYLFYYFSFRSQLHTTFTLLLFCCSETRSASQSLTARVRVQYSYNNTSGPPPPTTARAPRILRGCCCCRSLFAELNAEPFSPSWYSCAL